MLTFGLLLALSAAPCATPVVLVAPALVRQDGPAPATQPTPDSFLALVKEYTQAKSKWRFAERAATTDEARAEHQRANPIHVYWPKVEALVEAGDARGLVWMCEAVADKLADKQEVVAKKRELVAKIFAEHADAPWAATEVVAMLGRQRGWFDEDWVRARLEELAGKSQNKEVSASAWFELAKRLDASRSSPEDKARAAQIVARIGADFRGTRAANELLARQNARNVEVGGSAPDFEAVDVQGVAFKLSDYRGKVVMLDFWGFWCGPCVQALPKVRALQERFKDAPFAVLGVNTDTDKSVVVQKSQGFNVTWRNAFTGGKDNEISRLYRITGYPTILLIDHRGVVRHRYLGAPGGKALEEALEELVESARQQKD